MSIEQMKNKIIPILKSYEVEYAGVFGSVARGEAREDSDIDLFVRFKKAPSLVKFIRLENELKDALNVDVDLVVAGSEKPFVKSAIQKDLASLYGKR